MNTLELDDALNTLIIQGRSLEAFQEFYAEDDDAEENDEKVVRERFYHK